MKASLLLSIYLLAIGSANAWVTPTRKFLEGAVTAAGIAGVITFAPLSSNAIEGAVFSHQYNDPKHPNCKRIVVVRPDATVALSGTDGNPGCPEDGSGNLWRLAGEVDGNTILVDFGPKVNALSASEEPQEPNQLTNCFVFPLPKGGPANLKGVWEAQGTPGIRWPDGNKWTVKD